MLLLHILHSIFTLPNYFIIYIYHNNLITFILRFNQTNFTSLNENDSFMTRIQPTHSYTDCIFVSDFWV